MATNEEVVYAFIKHRSKEAKHLSTNGTTLWSYDSVLAQWHGDWLIVYGEIATYSNTSQKHTAILRRKLGYHEKQVYWFNNEAKTLEYSHVLEMINYIQKHKSARKNKKIWKDMLIATQSKLLKYLDNHSYEPGYKIKIKNYIKQLEYQFNLQDIWNKKTDKLLFDKIIKEIT